jgi:NADPH-dependent F420 reductase
MARVRIDGRTNDEATRACDIAILAVPDLPPADVLASLAPNLSNKLVISPIVPKVVKDGIFSVSPSTESAAERVAGALPAARVARDFQTVPAPMLTRLDAELDYDVLVAAETREIFEEAVPVVSSVGKLRPLYAGPLVVSRMIEAITPALLNVGKLNKLKAPSLKLV